MTVANCKRCGRIFNRVRRDICPSCITEEDQVFIKVRHYLRENPNAYMDSVVLETGVELEIIIEMIRDGRLILSNNPNMGYACERCGLPTQIGRYCAKCTKEVASSLNAARDHLSAKKAEHNRERGGYYSR